MHTETRPARAA